MTAEIQNGFTAQGLPLLLVKNLMKIGVSEPKPIQVKAIPPLLEGRDILAIAQTGSGKTFAFSLPILTKIISMGAKRQARTATALILAPTRELAVQIEAAIRAVSKDMHLRTALVLGGVSRLKQIRQMAPGVDILIATPGRLMDHVREGNIDLSYTQFFVLDEADRMLDMGFIRDVRAIAGRLAKKRQTALFSATMPKEIIGLADSLLKQPLKVETAPQGTTVAEIRETVYSVSQRDKKHILARLLAQDNFRSVIVFTRTKHGADAVARFLDKAGCLVEVIHGNKSQNARQRALDTFRKGRIRVLIATDIAARGIDVPGISHVVNFEFPVEAESYVHRIGRTGRNGAIGDALTLYDAGAESSRLRAIQKLTGKKLVPQALPPLAEAIFPVSEKTAEEKQARKTGSKMRGRARNFTLSDSGNSLRPKWKDSRGESRGNYSRGERNSVFGLAEEKNATEALTDRKTRGRYRPGQKTKVSSGRNYQNFKLNSATKDESSVADFIKPQKQRALKPKMSGGKKNRTRRANYI